MRNIAWEVCPGVSSFCGSAAALSLEYTLPGISQSVIITRTEGRTAVPEKESLRSLAAHQATMVLFLSSGLAEEVSRELIGGGYAPDTPAAVVYKATWPEERKFVTTLSLLPEKMKEEGISRTALIIVGNVIDSGFERSKLYDPCFTTGYRKGMDTQNAGKEKGYESRNDCLQ